jgi:hypothetical protein
MRTNIQGKTKGMASMRKKNIFPSRYWTVVAILLGLLTCGYATAFPINERECLAMATTHSSYDSATHRLMKISEVQLWKMLVEKNNRHIAWIPSSDNTAFHDGQCFWEINLYEDTGDQLLRWNAYQIGLNKSLVYRLDIVNPGQLVPVEFLQNKN